MTNGAAPFPFLPKDVTDAIVGSRICEFVTFTKDGVPLDTPLFHFIGENGTTSEVATGLSYPAKAERARRNNKIAVLVEGPDGKGGASPSVLLQGIATIRDQDIQANLDLYAQRCLHLMLAVLPPNVSWEQIQAAIWYWARIFIECTPVRGVYWPAGAGADDEPIAWHAPAELTARPADPPPPGANTKAPSWPVTDWRSRADSLLEQTPRPHLSLVDGEFPSVARTISCAVVPEGFVLQAPRGLPGDHNGVATLCFNGRGTFVGRVAETADGLLMTVERMMPDLPIVSSGVFTPSDEARTQLLERLDKELERRSQGRPTFRMPRPADFVDPS